MASIFVAAFIIFSYMVIGIDNDRIDSQQAWQTLQPQLYEDFHLLQQSFPSSSDNRIGLDNYTVFLSIVNVTSNRLLFFHFDGGLVLLWFPYEGIVYYHYIHTKDIGGIS
jgi:hypothetical protein